MTHDHASWTAGAATRGRNVRFPAAASRHLRGSLPAINGSLDWAPGKADRVGWGAVRDEGRNEVDGLRGPNVLGRLPQLGDGPPPVAGDDGALQLLVPVGAHLRVRDPDQEVRVSAEDGAAAAGPPQAAARGHDGAEVLLGDHVAGLLGELADGCRLDGLASVQPPPGLHPQAAPAPAPE